MSLSPAHAPVPPIVVEPPDPHGSAAVLIDGRPEPYRLAGNVGGRARLNPNRVDVLLLPPDTEPRAPRGVTRREVVVDGWRVVVEVESEARARLRARASRGGGPVAAGGPSEVRAMIPGRILAIGVAEGDVVEAGQAVMTIEAMKMQNELRAPRAGRIDRLAVAPGQTVELGDLLVVIEPSKADAPNE